VFKKHIDSLVTPVTSAVIQKILPLKNAPVTLNTGAADIDTVTNGTRVFSDTTGAVHAFAKDLEGLRGLRLSFKQQVTDGTNITFTSPVPVKVLVGFFTQKSKLFLKEPELETNATANDYGQAEIKIANALIVKDMPSVNIHTYSFKKGTNTLVLAKGACLILGFVNDNDPVKVYDAGLNEPGKKNIDWLFEN
jgi:hypothetical protein